MKWNDGQHWRGKQGLFDSRVWPDGGGVKGNVKTLVVHQPNDVKVINTSAFIKTKIDYGLNFVFHLMDSVTLTIISLIDNGVSGFAWGTDACLCLPQFGWRPVDPLSSDQLAGKTSLIFLDSKDLAVTGKQNIYCCINSFQPRCWPTPVFRASKVDKQHNLTNFHDSLVVQGSHVQEGHGQEENTAPV